MKRKDWMCHKLNEHLQLWFVGDMVHYLKRKAENPRGDSAIPSRKFFYTRQHFVMKGGELW